MNPQEAKLTTLDLSKHVARRMKLKKLCGVALSLTQEITSTLHPNASIYDTESQEFIRYNSTIQTYKTPSPMYHAIHYTLIHAFSIDSHFKWASAEAQISHTSIEIVKIRFLMISKCKSAQIGFSITTDSRVVYDF